MEKTFLAKRLNTQGLVEWLNDNFIKDNRKPFNRNDVNAYIRRGHLPKYFGEIEIEKIETKYCTIKLYNVVTKDSGFLKEGEVENEDKL